MASQPRFDYVQAEASNNEFTVAHQDGMMWVTCSTCNGAVREYVRSVLTRTSLC